MKRQRMSTESEMDHSYTVPTISDNSNVFLNKIRNVYANKLLNDITLVVGGMLYPAHRFILCLSSDVFEIMLMNSKWSESCKEVIELQEVHQCIEVFPIFLQYFYTGELMLDQTNIMPLLVLADKYNVKDLIALCIKYMCDHIAESADQGQLVTWFQYVLSLNQPATANASYYCKIWQDPEYIEIESPWNNLLKACRSYIKWNLDSCTKCFNTFQCDVLVGLLKQSDIVVYDEMQLFGSVASWLNYQSAEKLMECNDSDILEDYMSSLTEHVMSHIRYPMILPRQMAQLLTAPIVKKNKEYFVDKMAAAMEYNLVKMEKKSNAEYVLECTPRLYTSERWGKFFRVQPKTIQNYQSIEREIVTCRNLFDREQNLNIESNWEIEMYLKGISFDKALLRSWHGSIELPEVIIRKVRATIKMKLQQYETRKTKRYVRIAILVYAVQNKIAHVMTVVQKVVMFNPNQSMINIDDFMVYDAVNRSTTNEDIININDTNVSYNTSDRVPLKFHVIITPVVSGLTHTHVGTSIKHVHF